MRFDRRLLRAWSCAALVSLAGLAGCSDMLKPGVSKHVDPQTGATYYLAVPAKHTAEKQWTLVVTCHGTPPWDTAVQQIGRWRSMADSKDIIIAAPILEGTASDNPFLTPSRQIPKQERDERVILSLVERLRPAYNVDPSRVFLTGWSGGGYAVLYTGLRHPEVFRALSVHQGNFDEKYVEPVKPHLDPYQPVQLTYGIADPLKTEARAALKWLREQRMAFAVTQELTGHHRLLPEVAYRFFRRCVQEYPWIVVTANASRADELMAVRFRVRSAPRAEAYLWNFGDGAISRAPAPEHVYSEKGTYRVQLTVRAKDGRQHVRAIQVTVPVARIGVAAGQG